MSWKSRSACVFLFLALMWGLFLPLAAPDPVAACVYTATPIVEFSAAGYSASEYSITTTIDVTLSFICGGTTSAPVTVNYATSNGTATAPGDYASASGPLTFPAGISGGTQSFQVTIYKDLENDGDETVQLALSSLSGAGAIYGANQTATLTITDVPVILTLDPASAAICSGGINSALHQATLTATMTDGTDPFVGETIGFSTNKGSLDTSSGVTDASGQAKVVLTSDNKASEDPLTYLATVTASAGVGLVATSLVEFQATQVSLTLDNSAIFEGQSIALTANVSWAGQPAASHALAWRISRIWDDTSTLVYNGTGSVPPNYGSILAGASTQADANGDGTATYQAGSLSGTVELEVADTSVQKMTSSDNPKATAQETQKAVTVTLSPDPTFLSLGGTAFMTASVMPPEAASFITYTTVNPTFATVAGSDPTLTVTGLAKGNTYVEAHLGSTLMASAKVCVVTVTYSPGSGPALTRLAFTMDSGGEAFFSSGTQVQIDGAFTPTDSSAESFSVTHSGGEVSFNSGIPDDLAIAVGDVYPGDFLTSSNPGIAMALPGTIAGDVTLTDGTRICKLSVSFNLTESAKLVDGTFAEVTVRPVWPIESADELLSVPADVHLYGEVVRPANEFTTAPPASFTWKVQAFRADGSAVSAGVSVQFVLVSGGSSYTYRSAMPLLLIDNPAYEGDNGQVIAIASDDDCSTQVVQAAP